MAGLESSPNTVTFKEKQIFAWAAMLGVITIGSLLTANSLGKMIGEDAQHFTRLALVQVSLLAALIILMVRWIIATTNEAKLWDRWTSLEEPPYAWESMLGIAAYLGGTIAFLARPVLATAWFTLGTAFSIWTQRYCCSVFKDAFPREGETIPVAMTHYWIDKPQAFRNLIITVFAAIALLFAVTGWLWPHGHASAYTLAAYWILFGTVVVAETQIHFWRRTRDRGIQLHQRKEAFPVEAGYCQLECSLRACVTLLPILSFVLQLYFALSDGTVAIMLRHPAVMYSDWLLIPFNYFAASAIDWTRGVRLYVITAASTVLVLLTHAIWAAQGKDLGHMIARSGAILAPGWVHIGFCILEMTLMASFVFCRRGAKTTWIAAAFGTAYFVAVGVGGYAMHHHLILSDAVVVIGGLVFVAAAPMIPAFRKAAHRTV